MSICIRRYRYKRCRLSISETGCRAFDQAECFQKRPYIIFSGSEVPYFPNTSSQAGEDCYEDDQDVSRNKTRVFRSDKQAMVIQHIVYSYFRGGHETDRGSHPKFHSNGARLQDEKVLGVLT